ncbi:SDR family NAD(P)-dependent oxidoreductase [Kitasatospora sp. NPDC056531]|uniref:SDR family NAD(P)-dependent oxidoreductase n=1 Tax=Kitasatospora sp. NPDC056531 TaxID=3345856 RepID=UPI0036A12F2F
MQSFPYRTAMVTGASSGIGEGFARLLARQGVDLVLIARRGDLLKQLADELQSANAVTVEVMPLDLTEEDQLAAAEQRLADPDRPIDLLVNNAGSSGSGYFAELPLERELHTLTLNATVPLRLTRACLPGMIERRAGGIVNISSISAVMPRPRSATYAASKSFLNSLGESLAMEVGHLGVHITTVHTGLTDSGFHAAAGVPVETLPKIRRLTPEEVAGPALEAVAAGRASVVPGTGYRIRLPLMRVMPRSLVRKMVRRVHKV